ncbi:MAG TPA: sulfurtransferase TusA family protein [Azospirillaceae bacterium]|nr:sulfurtransferase TusA family protein [Azospirillaceae bacterium]
MNGEAAGADEASIDCSGLICPLPVLRARKALKALPPGGVLRVTATDKAAPRDFRVWCEEAGHTLLESGEEGGAFVFRIRRGAD